MEEDEDVNRDEEDEDEDVERVVTAANRKTYLRGRFLGQGAHAVVYLASDLTGNRNIHYAMKVMTLKSSEEENRLVHHKGRSREVRLNQVLREVEIHSLMSHGNIVRLESHFRNDSKFYMILEYCEMNNLTQLLKARKRFSEIDTRNFLKQLLAGLGHIHGHGIIHRDLKPANIYVSHNFILKIGDFGLADRACSKTTKICGTPNYISPEVLKERGYTTAVDIWALGCIAYQMITGRPPFEADNQAATYDLIRTHRYSAIPPHQAGPALRHLVNWMLAFRPEDRPSASSVLGHTWMKRGQQTSVKQSPSPRRYKNGKDIAVMPPVRNRADNSVLVRGEETEISKEIVFLRGLPFKKRQYQKNIVRNLVKTCEWFNLPFTKRRDEAFRGMRFDLQNWWITMFPTGTLLWTFD